MTTAILPTNNEDWAFWGTIGQQTADCRNAWALATTAIGEATGCTPESVRDFLDSRHGRHFANDVSGRLFNGMTLPHAIDATVDRWMGWTIGKRTEQEYGIPSDLPYLTGWVMNCEIEADL